MDWWEQVSHNIIHRPRYEEAYGYSYGASKDWVLLDRGPEPESLTPMALDESLLIPEEYWAARRKQSREAEVLYESDHPAEVAYMAYVLNAQLGDSLYEQSWAEQFVYLRKEDGA